MTEDVSFEGWTEPDIQNFVHARVTGFPVSMPSLLYLLGRQLQFDVLLFSDWHRNFDAFAFLPWPVTAHSLSIWLWEIRDQWNYRSHWVRYGYLDSLPNFYGHYGQVAWIQSGRFPFVGGGRMVKPKEDFHLNDQRCTYPFKQPTWV